MKRLIGVILLFAIVFPVFAVNSNSLNIFDSNKLNRLKGFEVGEKLSDIQYDLFENSSWTRVSPHGSGPQGLDHLYLKFDDKGNIKGTYTDGQIKVSHWMNEEEKKEYLSRKEK